MSDATRTLVIIATYNEMENLPPLVDEIFSQVPETDLLVVDDNSPDGTGRWCDDRANSDPRVHCLHRPGKLGLGTATIAGMKYGIEHGYEFVMNMDADFSHHPRYLPAIMEPMLAENSQIDISIGSRYVRGGGVTGWPLKRRLMSRCINLYARCLLGLKVKDTSGAFRCYRTALLRKLDFKSIESRGYSFQEEVLWRLKRLGARFYESPIVFADRTRGTSKINAREAVAALVILLRLGVRNLFGRP